MTIHKNKKSLTFSVSILALCITGNFLEKFVDCERVPGGLVRSLHGVSLLPNLQYHKFLPRKC